MSCNDALQEIGSKLRAITAACALHRSVATCGSSSNQDCATASSSASSLLFRSTDASAAGSHIALGTSAISPASVSPKAMRAGCQSAPPIVSATWSRPNGGASPFSMLSASWCATVRSRYERDTASRGVSIPAAARLISIWRRVSGSPLQASAIPPLVRIDDIRFFRPTGDISRNPCAVAPSMAVATIASMAARRPWCAIDPSRPRLADDRVDFGSLVLGSPIAHRDQPPNLCRRQRGGDLRKRSGNRAAHSRIWIEQEQNRGAARFGDHLRAPRRRPERRGLPPAWHDRFRSAHRRP